MKDIIIKTSGVTKEYKQVKALDQVNLEIKQGDIYGLIGKNGAGKTTLLRILSGQAVQTNGQVSIFGATSEKELNDARKRMGAIIETPSFYPNLTAKQNLNYYCIQRGIPDKNCVDQILREVGLSDTGSKKYKSFSLGMKQRLGLALALLNKPELLILDEPINGLDPFGIVEIRNLLLKLNSEKNITIIISSHILAEMTNLVTHYGFINDGKLIKQLTAEELSNECNQYLELKVDQVEKMTALLEDKLAYKNYKVTPDRTIQIYEHIDNLAKVSELAIANGIGLLSIAVKEINLESYFISLVGGPENA